MNDSALVRVISALDLVINGLRAHNANNRQLCCVDFLINDIAQASMKQALTIEHVLDYHRLSGIVYCSYKTDTLLKSEIENLIELFEMHDQIFLLKNDECEKLHITKENVHKSVLKLEGAGVSTNWGGPGNKGAVFVRLKINNPSDYPEHPLEAY